jgi:hypothetical protein
MESAICRQEVGSEKIAVTAEELVHSSGFDEFACGNFLVNTQKILHHHAQEMHESANRLFLSKLTDDQASFHEKYDAFTALMKARLARLAKAKEHAAIDRMLRKGMLLDCHEAYDIDFVSVP